MTNSGKIFNPGPPTFAATIPTPTGGGEERRSQHLPGRDVADATHNSRSEFDQVYEAALKGVQSGFDHLSTQDICYPPLGWADARVARQIADYIAVHELQVSQSKLARELNRSRKVIRAAMAAIDHRLDDERFSERYAVMVKQAKAGCVK